MQPERIGLGQGADVEFTKRVGVVSIAASWGCVPAGVAAAALTARFVPAAAVSAVGVAAWSAAGALLALVTTVLVARALRGPTRLSTRLIVARVLLTAQVIVITGLATASGGLLGCTFLLLVVTVLFASLVFDKWHLAGFALLLATSVAVIGFATSTWTSAGVPLGLAALVLFPLMTVIDGHLAQGIIAMEERSNRARLDLTKRVDKLTHQLEKAAAGDLTAILHTDAEGDDQTLVVLSDSVNVALETCAHWSNRCARVASRSRPVPGTC
jgi:hypothetical protein